MLCIYSSLSSFLLRVTTRSLLFAVFGFAIRTDGAAGTAALTSLLLALFRLRGIVVRIAWVITEIIIVGIDETVKLGAESKVELKSIHRVQIIKIVGNVVSFLQCLHKLVIIRVDIIVFTIMDTLRLLLALKDVEERFSGDCLDDDTFLSRLFVLLCLFSLLLGHVLTLVPLDLSADNLYRLVRVIISDSDKLEWFRVREELIRRK